MLGIVGAFLVYVILQLFLLRKQSQDWMNYLIGGYTGFFKLPITALLIAYASEAFYPLGEATITGFILAGGKVFGFALGLGAAALLKSIQKVDKNDER